MALPREKTVDSTLALLSEPYTFISRRCQYYQSDIFETRLMLRKAICTTGEDAARMFYHPGRFTRKGALPPTALMLLQDKGSVMTLDGEAHRHRKQMFMSLLSPKSRQQLKEITADEWRNSLSSWERLDEVVLHTEVEAILGRAVCRWTGVPTTESEVKLRTKEFAAMIDGAGSVGPRNWRGMALRFRSERWARGVIRAIRDHKVDVPAGSAAHAAAWHRDPDGELLNTKVAALELINLLRPIVAVARFVTFAALALHEYPEWREKLRSEGEAEREMFVHEVRRFYPFFPFIAGRVRDEFEWRGHRFPKNAWVILDIYGTNHDPRVWADPDVFRPERFRDWSGNEHDDGLRSVNDGNFRFIPQGGGDINNGHRCAGEGATIDLTKLAVYLLVSEMQYDVPEQNLWINPARLPAIPESRFVMRNVRRI